MSVCCLLFLLLNLFINRIAEMEETHQDVVLKLREDMKRGEEKRMERAVSEVRSEEEDKRQVTIQEFKMKERERIQAAVDAERRMIESQHGSMAQLQQVRPVRPGHLGGAATF